MSGWAAGTTIVISVLHLDVNRFDQVGRVLRSTLELGMPKTGPRAKFNWIDHDGKDRHGCEQTTSQLSGHAHDRPLRGVYEDMGWLAINTQPDTVS